MSGRAIRMTAGMTGVDPYKGSNTVVAIDAAEVPLGTIRVRASAADVHTSDR